MKKLIKWIRSLLKRPIVMVSGRVYRVDVSKFKDGDLLYVGLDGKLTNKTPEWIKEKTYCQDPITKKIYSSVILGAWKNDVEGLAIGSPNHKCTCADFASIDKCETHDYTKIEKYLVAGEYIQDGDLVKSINGKIYKV